MEMLRQQLRRRDDRRREQRTQEEALQTDRHRSNIELRRQPKQQLQAHRDGEVDRDRALLAHPRRDEAQHDAADGDAGPEARGDHAGGEAPPAPNRDHEDDDPAAQRDLDADVEQQEERAQPGDARGGSGGDGLVHAVPRAGRGARVGGLEGGAGGFPEAEDGDEELEGGGADLVEGE